MFLFSIQSRLERSGRLPIILILTVLGLLTFANAIHHPFVHDDVVFIQQNPHIEDLNLKNLFLQTSGPDSELALINKYYRPLLELVNRVLYRIVGFNPYGFHLFNVLLHIINSFLVFCVIRSVIGRKGLALMSAVIFLVHPVQNEAVACISGISNLMFTFLCLASFMAYLAAVHPADGGTKKPLYAAGLVLFLFALLAKEQSVILPFLVIAHELCFSDGPVRNTIKKYWLHISGFFIVLVSYFAMRKMLFGFALLRPADNQGELWIRILAIPRSLLVYFSLIFFPNDLHYYRSQNVLLPWLGPLLILLGVVLVVAVIVWRTPKPQRRWVIFGLAWFIITLGPTLNIVPLINEYSTLLTSEHFLYLPLAGMALAVVAAGDYWVRQKYRKPVLAAFMVLVAVFVGMNIKQNTYWCGEIPLFERTLRFQKNFGRVRFLLAKAYSAAGRYEDAVREDRKALAIMKGYEQKVRDEDVKEFYRGFIKGIGYHLGYCLDILGRNEEALEHFKSVLELDSENGTVHYSVGLSYVKLGDRSKAIEAFERAVTVDENNLMAMNGLAVCYKEAGEYEKAEKLLRTVIEKDSESVSARWNLLQFLKGKENRLNKKETGVHGKTDH